MPPSRLRTPRRRLVAAALLSTAVAGLVGWRWPRAPAGGEAGGEPIWSDDVCVTAPTTPYDPASGQGVMAPRSVPADARCPVCGMYPARSPDWAAQIIFKHGDAQFFDSPLSLFKYLQRIEHYSRGRQAASDIGAIYVTDSDAAGWIDARDAFYVEGSSALGPMRAGNLPAFATVGAAASFAQRRGGQVRRFSEVDEAVVARIAPSGGPGAHRH